MVLAIAGRQCLIEVLCFYFIPIFIGILADSLVLRNACHFAKLQTVGGQAMKDQQTIKQKIIINSKQHVENRIIMA
jgi:hypothetical protein